MAAKGTSGRPTRTRVAKALDTSASVLPDVADSKAQLTAVKRATAKARKITSVKAPMLAVAKKARATITKAELHAAVANNRILAVYDGDEFRGLNPDTFLDKDANRVYYFIGGHSIKDLFLERYGYNYQALTGAELEDAQQALIREGRDPATLTSATVLLSIPKVHDLYALLTEKLGVPLGHPSMMRLPQDMSQMMMVALIQGANMTEQLGLPAGRQLAPIFYSDIEFSKDSHTDALQLTVINHVNGFRLSSDDSVTGYVPCPATIRNRMVFRDGNFELVDPVEIEGSSENVEIMRQIILGELSPQNEDKLVAGLTGGMTPPFYDEIAAMQVSLLDAVYEVMRGYTATLAEEVAARQEAVDALDESAQRAVKLFETQQRARVRPVGVLAQKLRILYGTLRSLINDFNLDLYAGRASDKRIEKFTRKIQSSLVAFDAELDADLAALTAFTPEQRALIKANFDAVTMPFRLIDAELLNELIHPSSAERLQDFMLERITAVQDLDELTVLTRLYYSLYENKTSELYALLKDQLEVRRAIMRAGAQKVLSDMLEFLDRAPNLEARLKILQKYYNRIGIDGDAVNTFVRIPSDIHSTILRAALVPDASMAFADQERVVSRFLVDMPKQVIADVFVAAIGHARTLEQVQAILLSYVQKENMEDGLFLRKGFTNHDFLAERRRIQEALAASVAGASLQDYMSNKAADIFVERLTRAPNLQARFKILKEYFVRQDESLDLHSLSGAAREARIKVIMAALGTRMFDSTEQHQQFNQFLTQLAPNFVADIYISRIEAAKDVDELKEVLFGYLHGKNLATPSLASKFSPEDIALIQNKVLVAVAASPFVEGSTYFSRLEMFLKQLQALVLDRQGHLQTEATLIDFIKAAKSQEELAFIANFFDLNPQLLSVGMFKEQYLHEMLARREALRGGFHEELARVVGADINQVSAQKFKRFIETRTSVEELEFIQRELMTDVSDSHIKRQYENAILFRMHFINAINVMEYGNIHAPQGMQVNNFMKELVLEADRALRSSYQNPTDLARIREDIFERLRQRIEACTTSLPELLNLYEAYQQAKHIQVNGVQPLKVLMCDQRFKTEATRFQDYYEGHTFATTKTDSTLLLLMKKQRRDLALGDAIRNLTPVQKDLNAELKGFRRKPWYTSNTFLITAPITAAAAGVATFFSAGAAIPAVAALSVAATHIAALAAGATAAAGVGVNVFRGFWNKLFAYTSPKRARQRGVVAVATGGSIANSSTTPFASRPSASAKVSRGRESNR